MHGDNRLDLLKPIVIEDNVFVGWGAMILPGVTVGKNSIVAAGAVVTKNIPENQVWGGVPAKFIKTIEEYYEDNKEMFLYTHEMEYEEKKNILMDMYENVNSN